MGNRWQLWPLVVLLGGALGLLALGLVGLDQRFRALRAQEAERLREECRREAAQLRARLLSGELDSDTAVRFRIADATPVIEPAPVPPGVAGRFRLAERALVERAAGLDATGLAALLPEARELGADFERWFRARQLWKNGDPEASARIAAEFTEEPRPGLAGPVLRLLADLGAAPPPWTAGWLEGQSAAVIESCARPAAGDAWRAVLAGARRAERARRLQVELAGALPDPGDDGLLLARGTDVLGIRRKDGAISGFLVPVADAAAELAGAVTTGTLQVARGGGIEVLPGVSLVPPDPPDADGGGIAWLYVLTISVFSIGLVLSLVVLQRERRAARQREDFLRSATHELKTPLASLRLLLESLVSGRIDDPERRETYLRLMQGESERLSGLVEQALDFRRLQAGDLQSAPRSLDLRAHVEEFALLYAPQLEGEDRKLTLQATDLEGHADPDSLRRILWNLCENARLHGGGEVRLAATQQNGHAVLSVEDEGPGLPHSEWERVFEPFARGAGAGEGRVPGLGLGLVFVRRLARDQGGDCRIVASDRGFKIEVDVPSPDGVDA